MGKYILPWFGGTSAVWTTCMMVYQTLLLAGYTYAHGLSGLHLKKHVRLHFLILGLSFVIFICLWMQWKTPITPGQNWQPVDSSIPILRIIGLLLICIGLPFVVLSSTSSLVQKWFSIINPGKSPYGFYVISNIGSMLALITYPFVFEPRLRLVNQAIMWSILYVVYLAMCAFCVVIVWKKGASSRDQEVQSHLVEPVSGKRKDVVPSVLTHLEWLFLSMLPCVILLATSTEMTQNIAPIPLLWILCLALYLLSFIICFSPVNRPTHWFFIPLLLVSSFLAILIIKDGPTFGIVPAIIVFSAALFSSCMLCNTILYSLRPHPVHLTRYYVIIALGGALGGVLIGIVAPLVFKAYYEFRFGLSFCCLVGVIILWQEKHGWMRVVRFPLIFFSIVMMLLLFITATHVPSHAIYRARNFYGAVTVRSINGPHGWVRRSLLNGNISHGVQLLNNPMEYKPISYYAKEGGVGFAMQRFSFKPLRIGVIGLGVGMICTYTQPDDYVKFYEINPEVVNIARNPDYFTYLSQCLATVDISLGDARISLEHELKEGHPRNYDVLLIDAFTADSVPMHLLTREAFKLYLSHITANGIIAVNVSNTYIDLVPQIWAQKKYFDLDGAIIRAKKDYRKCVDASTWILLSRDSSFFLMPEISKAALDPSLIPAMDVWTDDYGSLLPAIRTFRIRMDNVNNVFRVIMGLKKPKTSTEQQ
ncbi:MAG: fused MFS/spermidine synthase [Kiritimatiellae bacterium]|nr:fused MFS/spermidine synthase [Kiritimatiellia bacterium]